MHVELAGDDDEGAPRVQMALATQAVLPARTSNRSFSRTPPFLCPGIEALTVFIAPAPAPAPAPVPTPPRAIVPPPATPAAPAAPPVPAPPPAIGGGSGTTNARSGTISSEGGDDAGGGGGGGGGGEGEGEGDGVDDDSVALQRRHGALSQAFRRAGGGGGGGGGVAEGAAGSAAGAPLLITFEDMARGLHFDGVDIVFILGIPDSPATYLHLAGRTGRQPALRGTVVTVCPGNAHTQLCCWGERLGGVAFEEYRLGAGREEAAEAQEECNES